ncbi:lysophospholipase A [Aspergillus floccosus]
MHGLRSLLYLAGIPLIQALPPSDGRDKFDWNSTKYMLVFGDSYTYIQGTYGHPNYSFIGDQLKFEYDAHTLLRNKIVQNQTGTAEGGPNWVEFLTGCGVNEGLTSPFSCDRQLWDFAYAGADISVKYTPLHHNHTISLVNQITQYKEYGHPVLKRIVRPTQTLVAIWIGINDINDSAKYAVHFPTFYNDLIATLFDSVRQLHALGYRSYLFMNLPPLDRTERNQQAAIPSPNATQIAWFNAALQQHADRFARAHPRTNVMVYDAHAVLGDMMDHPAQYGIVNTTHFCRGYDQPDIAWNYQAYGCPTPVDTYFWFNSGHLTSHVHKVLAEALEKTLAGWTG